MVEIQVLTNDSGEESDHTDGDDKAGPAAPIISGRDEGKQNLPKHREEMHDVVEARRQFLLTALLIIIIFPWEEKVAES